MEYQLPSVSILTIFLSFIFITVKLLKQSKTNRHTPNLPPGPRRLPIIGNIHQLLCPLPHHRLTELSKKYGGIMHLQLGEVPHVIISSPEAGKEMLKTHDANFSQRPFLLAACYATYNFKDLVFAPYGEYWKQLRKLCVLELLSAKRVQSFRSIREEEVSNLISSIASTGELPFNFSRKLFSLTYNIVARASFGQKCKDQEAFIKVVEELTECAGGFTIADVFPSIKFLQVIGGIGSRLKSACQESDRLLESVMKDHRDKKGITERGGDDEKDDLVDVLLKLQEHGDLEFSLTDENIKAVLLVSIHVLSY
uniref:Premnaspirodiene oxygenase-like n=1 Tax=Rhizophora mucronata TaxID=61149 RepID=A0A2P2IPQ7_RHIMU